MSTELTPEEFTKVCTRVMRSLSPVGTRSQQVWLGDWQAATVKMKYLKCEQIVISDSLRYQIRIRTSLKQPNLHLDFIKPDVASLWNQISAEAEESAHCFTNHEGSFECQFLAIAANSYITGTIVVSSYVEDGVG